MSKYKDFAMFVTFIDWLEERQIACFYKTTLGIECPGCGIQRALIALLRGDLIESIKLFPALIPTVAMLILLVVHVSYGVINGRKILISMLILNSVIVFISYIFKMFL